MIKMLLNAWTFCFLLTKLVGQLPFFWCIFAAHKKPGKNPKASSGDTTMVDMDHTSRFVGKMSFVATRRVSRATLRRDVQFFAMKADER